MKRRALAFIALLACCNRDPEIVARPITVYSLRSCPVAESQAFSVIYGSGDYEPTAASPPIAQQYLRDVGQGLGALPAATQSLIVDVSERDLGWRGVGDVARTGSTNILVWRPTETCRFTRDVERRSDMAFGVFGRHFMIAGGRTLGSDQVPHVFLGDLSTGAIERLNFGLSTRRIRPSITAFGIDKTSGLPNALVAGGSDPDSNTPLATAEMYVPKLGAPSDVGDFEQQRIDLSEPRMQHGAITLVTGETLLVGGRGTAGALRSMEIVDPVTRRTRTAGVALLAVKRISPTVLRLASGEILVAGGVDEQGNGIPTLEWFAPDALTPSKRPQDLVTGTERAFVPLAAGGALAVIRQATADFKTVWVISAEGTLEAATPIDPLALTSVRLFQGAAGSPVLWTGSAWMRWAPWLGSFQPMIDAPTTGPDLDAIDNGDSGLALWVQDRDAAGFNITGFRFDAKTRFDSVHSSLLVDGTQLAPDRLAGFATSAVQFDPRGVVLGPGASVFVTDVTFADFTLDLDVTASAPEIVLRDEQGAELEVGGASCAFAQAATHSLHVSRHDRRVDVSVDGAVLRACASELAPGARVSIGIRGSQASNESAARNLRVTRQ